MLRLYFGLFFVSLQDDERVFSSDLYQCDKFSKFRQIEFRASTEALVPILSTEVMGRQCAQCRCVRGDHLFSNNQWNKGEGYSRCVDCISGRYDCSECGKSCGNDNNLRMHMQKHRSRTVSCPICGRQNFKTGAGAVAHVESGFCPSCPGRDNARTEILRFATQQRQLNPFLTGRKLLSNGEGMQVPDFPYQCTQCNRYFRDMSALLQHQDQKHNQTKLLTF